MSDIELSRQRFLDIQKLAQEGLAALPAPAADSFQLRAGESLAFALNQPLPIVTEGGARFPGSYTIPSNRTILFGAGSGIDAATGPALRVAPSTVKVTLAGGRHSSGGSESVVQVGENTANQTTLEAQPTDIAIIGMEIPTFRGKRAIALHGYRIQVTKNKVRDVWSAADADSQAILMGNARGLIDIDDNDLEAGSEIILSGGDQVRTLGMHPTGIRIRNNRITRPLAWMTDADATKRRVKNCVEFKDGIDVEISGNFISGNWNDPRVTQGCYAILLTPALDGIKRTPPAHSGVVGNVTIRDNTIINTGSGLQMIGRHYQAITDPALNAVVVERNKFRIDKTKFGGFGQFLKVGGEPHDLHFSDNLILQDGSSHVVTYKGDVLDPITGLSRPGGAIAFFSYQGNVAELGSYGFNIDGEANAMEDKLALNFTERILDSNTFKGSSRRTPMTLSTWMPAADFDARPDVATLRAL